MGQHSSPKPGAWHRDWLRKRVTFPGPARPVLLSLVSFFSALVHLGPALHLLGLKVKTTGNQGDGSLCRRHVPSCVWTRQNLADPILRDFLFFPLKIPHFLDSISFNRENQKDLIIFLVSRQAGAHPSSHFSISLRLTSVRPGFPAADFCAPTFGRIFSHFSVLVSTLNLVFYVSQSLLADGTMGFH